MKITLAQLNPVVGDIEGNYKKLEETVGSYAARSDLIVFSELYITGYPPRDLLEKKSFIDRARAAVDKAAELSLKYPETGIIAGVPLETGQQTEKALYNSALLINNGKILLQENKILLPAYDVFDEERYFHHTHEVGVIKFKGETIGLSICEDMWSEPEYIFNPIKALSDKGATLIINISASPFYEGKEKLRYEMIRKHARKYSIPFIFLNQVGGNDELVFDGRSMAVDSAGKCFALFPSFEECVETIDTGQGREVVFEPEDGTETIYKALVTGIKDYMRKCGFKKAVIGLSGGIDSSVTACLAAAALGKENVTGVLLPSKYTSQESIDYAEELSERLGIKSITFPIQKIFEQYKAALSKEINIEEGEIDITQQNIQARIRGNILMALSNKYGWLVLSTGNKSELAVGYSTLYGDLAGGLAVISDVPKTKVYELANYINRNQELIPSEVISRIPSAELKPGQKDQDTLPPYEILDEILFYYVEKNYSAKQIEQKGFEAETVNWVIDAVNKNEYKRRQAPPGLRVTTKAFGMGRRMPIASKYD